MVYVKLLYCGLHRAEHAFQAQVLYLENRPSQSQIYLVGGRPFRDNDVAWASDGRDPVRVE